MVLLGATGNDFIVMKAEKREMITNGEMVDMNTATSGTLSHSHNILWLKRAKNCFIAFAITGYTLTGKEMQAGFGLGETFFTIPAVNK